MWPIVAGVWDITITPDTLRILAIPIFVYAAYLDYHIRRVYNEIWLPLIGLCLITLSWDIGLALIASGTETGTFFGSIVTSIVAVPAIVFSLWRAGVIGGADLKGMILLALCFPTIPAIRFDGVLYPLTSGSTPIFAVTVLVNAVLVSWVYHGVIVAQNAMKRDLHPFMLRAVKRDSRVVDQAQGSVLVDTPEGSIAVDLDILRMYLRWRDITIQQLHSDTEKFRKTAPELQHEFTDGAVSRLTQAPHGRLRGLKPKMRSHTETENPHPVPSEPSPDDMWSADQFVNELKNKRETREVSVRNLRKALNTVTSQSSVWVSPSIPFFIPLTIGLLIGLTYGSLYTGATTMIAELIIRAMTGI